MTDTTNSLNDCRRDFELWFVTYYGWHKAPTAKTNASWQAWKAAWEIQDARVKGRMA